MRRLPPNYRIGSFNYDVIERYILIGTSIETRAHFERLLRLDMDADIDLQEEKMDTPSGVESFLWLPTKDFTPPSQTQLVIGAHFIEDMVNHKMRCYVHCNAGNGRAPTLVAAYYILARDMTVNQAILYIKKKRPSVNPNTLQRKALERFYRRLKKSRRVF